MLEKILSINTRKAGWNETSQCSLLLDFIVALAENDELVVQHFQTFLQERLEEETNHCIDLT